MARFVFRPLSTINDNVQIIELNARLGGGYPMAHQAGANFVRLLIDELCGRPLQTPEWIEGLAMTRWDDAVFWNVQSQEAQRCA